MIRRVYYWAVLPCLLASQVANANAVPATFDHAESSLAKLIEFPELRGDAKARLRCASQVQKNGKMKETGCFMDTAGDEIYVTAIVKAAKKARLNPANIDGKTFAVYVQFQVEFEKTGDDEIVRVLNNPGLLENIDAYGDEHIAAQRGLTRESWQKACPQYTRYTVWAKAHVAEDGQQGSYSVVPGDGPPITEKCRLGIIATLRESQFTPAYADGEAVPSSFIEPFGN